MSQFDDPSGAMLPPDDAEESGGVSAAEDAGAAAEPLAGDPFPIPMPEERLDRKVVVYWLLSGLMSWMFVATFLAGGLTLVYFKWQDAWPIAFPGVAAMAGLLLVWVVISPSLAWVRWRFRVDSELLIARYGILFIEEKAIPISRLQHVDLYRGLLERFFGLTTLIVFTAGTEGAHFRLPGLSVDRARELRDIILAARGDDVI